LAGVAAGDVRLGQSAGGGEAAVLPLEVRTGAFGTIADELVVPLSDGLVEWSPELVFPGLNPGEVLSRHTRTAPRAPILAADGTPLAKGPAAARSSPLGTAATAVTGSMATARRGRASELEAKGFPPGTLTGSSGLELAFDDRLAGRPGGRLLAIPEGGSAADGARVLADTEPQRGKPLRTTIDPELQSAAVTALADLFGGVAVLDARSGAVRAVAGVAFSAPQPPGSTFKVITTVAALDGGKVEPGDEFPIETAAVIDGREVANAHDEPCGGTFAQSFAKSCNSVFAPLGVDVGGDLLVETAEKFGYNAPPELYDAEATAAVDPPASTIPAEFDSDLDLGVSAIGQGEVLATPLALASAAQTIAAGGIRSPTPLVRDPDLGPVGEPVEVTSKQTADTVRDLMIGVVNDGTGSAAALPGIQVAGKTGTAELGPKALEPGEELGPGEEPELEVDAWFTAFAPAGSPKLAVAVMVVNADGDGGTIAAPIAREVLAAGL
jgi:penicillin-binding protein A